MKKIFFLMLMLLMLSTASMNAQVLIGLGEEPDGSAVLELNSANLGFLLPRVALQSTTDKTTIPNPVAGLTVYNIATAGTGATAVIPGIYVFTGTAWTLQAPPVITVQPASFTFRRLYDVNGDPNAPASVPAVNLSVVATGATNYQWYKKAKNMNAAASAIDGATSAGYNPTSTLTAWGLYQYYCVVSNAYGSVKSETADVAIGCGAKTTEGSWLSFMCQNLGAANAVYTNDESTGYGLDDISFQFGTDATNKIDNDAKGFLFQWGRNNRGTDAGYASRSSEIKAGPVPDGSYSGATVTGTDYLKKFITTTAAPYNWRSTQDEYLWRNYHNGDNDPCPGGWHVPSRADWCNIFIDKEDNQVPTAAIANTWLWKNGSSGTTAAHGTGSMVKPDGIRTTLFFPAAGMRSRTDGSLNTAGTYGLYWSSSWKYGQPVYTDLYPSFINPSSWSARGHGGSVRCVKNI
jgi:uncharacterized protein (TIGR02145 family)